MPWKAECAWLESGRGIVRKAVEIEVLPSISGPFKHPDIADGETMQVTGMTYAEDGQTATIGLGGRGSWPPAVGVTYPDI
jgi:hypothetical protein